MTNWMRRAGSIRQEVTGVVRTGDGRSCTANCGSCALGDLRVTFWGEEGKYQKPLPHPFHLCFLLPNPLEHPGPGSDLGQSWSQPPSFNPPCQAGDGTWVLMLQRCRHPSHCTTAGALRIPVFNDYFAMLWNVLLQCPYRSPCVNFLNVVHTWSTWGSLFMNLRDLCRQWGAEGQQGRKRSGWLNTRGEEGQVLMGRRERGEHSSSEDNGSWRMELGGHQMFLRPRGDRPI